MFIVWAENVASHSTWVIARCTNHNAAAVVAQAFRSECVVTNVQFPETSYRSN